MVDKMEHQVKVKEYQAMLEQRGEKDAADIFDAMEDLGLLMCGERLVAPPQNIPLLTQPPTPVAG